MGSLTEEEQVDFLALMDQRIAHGKDVLGAIEENVRILELLICMQAGVITTMEFVERVQGAVPDPLAE